MKYGSLRRRTNSGKSRGMTSKKICKKNDIIITSSFFPVIDPIPTRREQASEMNDPVEKFSPTEHVP